MKQNVVNKLFQVGLLLFACFISACEEKKAFVSVKLDDFKELRQEALMLSEDEIRETIHRMAYADSDKQVSDRHLRNYYLKDKSLVWIGRNGISDKADTLMQYISDVASFGLSPKMFRLAQMQSDIHRAKTLDFDTENNTITKVYARIEYNLTKAYLRYSEGERFGYTNPYILFNRLDVRDSDSVRTTYRQLYDVHTEQADTAFVNQAMAMIGGDAKKFSKFLSESHPQNPIYDLYLRQFRNATSFAEKKVILINMERARWRQGDYPTKHKKYVFVNLPSMHLDAVDGDEHIMMRIGFGTLKTKTPLLNSAIKRMDFNPQWVIPKSIVKTSICRHAGNRNYFESHNYFIQQRSTGKTVSSEAVTSGMLLSSDYIVVQRGGVGNALGRVVFRFDNNFSIYLHDTSNPGVFAQRGRSVSHGCIRVERPFDLSVFMLADKDESLIERIRYSMTVDYRPSHTNVAGGPAEESKEKECIDRNRMVSSIGVKPKVPLFITYYTLYPDANGTMRQYDDIYGFDNVIYKALMPYLK